MSDLERGHLNEERLKLYTKWFVKLLSTLDHICEQPPPSIGKQLFEANMRMQRAGLAGMVDEAAADLDDYRHRRLLRELAAKMRSQEIPLAENHPAPA